MIKVNIEIDEDDLRSKIGDIIRTEVYATSDCCSSYTYLEYVEDAEREIVNLIKGLLNA